MLLRIAWCEDCRRDRDRGLDATAASGRTASAPDLVSRCAGLGRAAVHVAAAYQRARDRLPRRRLCAVLLLFPELDRGRRHGTHRPAADQAHGRARRGLCTRGADPGLYRTRADGARRRRLRDLRVRVLGNHRGEPSARQRARFRSGPPRDPSLLRIVYVSETGSRSGCCDGNRIHLADGTPVWNATATDFARTGWRLEFSWTVFYTRHACLTVPAEVTQVPVVVSGRCDGSPQGP